MYAVQERFEKFKDSLPDNKEIRQIINSQKATFRKVKELERLSRKIDKGEALDR